MTGSDGRPVGGRALARALALGVAAALFYGSWAYLANVGVGGDAGLRAGAVQGALSFTATALLSLLLERLFAIGAAGEGGSLRRGFWLAAVGGSACAGAAMAAAHALAGTPRILVTIAPSLIIGSAFSFTYAAALGRSRGQGSR